MVRGLMLQWSWRIGIRQSIEPNTMIISIMTLVDIEKLWLTKQNQIYACCGMLSNKIRSIDVQVTKDYTESENSS